MLQATLFARIVVRAFDGGPFPGRALVLFASVVVARARRAGRSVRDDRSPGRGSRHVRAPARAGVVAPARRGGVDRATEAGEIATAAVAGVDGLEAYFGRYLPQVVLAVLVPIAVLLWTADIDLTSAVIMLATLPLIPVFMVLIGRYTEAKTRARWEALARLSNHFLDVVRGLPTLRAFNRGAAQAERIEAVSEDLPPHHDGDAPGQLPLRGRARPGGNAGHRARRGDARRAA